MLSEALLSLLLQENIAVTKSALPFLSLSADSNRNKSIISYDISESEADKSKTIDSLLPKKIVPKLELSEPIGPEPIKDFIPTPANDVKKKKKDKVSSAAKAEAGAAKETTQVEQKLDKAISKPLVIADSIVPDLRHQATAPKAKIQLLPKKELPKNYVESIFKGNSLQAHTISPKIRIKESADWITSILLVVVGIACILNISYRSRLRQLFNAFASNRFVGQIVREENVMFQRISIFLSLLFLLVASLFIFQIGRYYRLPISSNSSFMNYMVILFALFSFYFIKVMTFNFLGFLLKVEKEMKEYVFTIFLYNHFVGVALIPAVVLLAFVPGVVQKWVFIAGLICFVVAFIMRTLRSYGNVSAGSRFSIFYLFLYLCALEILPLVVVTKLISNIV